jgi:hypothetical protein
MSHDPATIVTDHHNNRREADAAIEVGFESHPNCDFIIMRVSGGPVEFTCTGQTGACQHSYAQDIDADWLRILAHFHPTEDLEYLTKLRMSPILKHWTTLRLERLAAHL